MSLQILTARSFIPTGSTYALGRAESFRLCEYGFQLNTTLTRLPNLVTSLVGTEFDSFMKVVMLCFPKSCQISVFFQRRTASFLLT